MIFSSLQDVSFPGLQYVSFPGLTRESLHGMGFADLRGKPEDGTKKMGSKMIQIDSKQKISFRPTKSEELSI